MCVHAFGNAPSPAIATYDLRKNAEISENLYGSDINKFVHRDFYVDDGLVSSSSREHVLNLIIQTKTALRDIGKICLQKIPSNDREILYSLCEEDLNKNIKDIHFGENNSMLPVQHSLVLSWDLNIKDSQFWENNSMLSVQYSLGLSWDLNTDTFLFQIQQNEKPNRRRGCFRFLTSSLTYLDFYHLLPLRGKSSSEKLLVSIGINRYLPPLTSSGESGNIFGAFA
jgi:hypothetical protein